MYTFEILKARQRAERHAFPDNLGLRVHRALSWLNRAEQCDDDDGRFIFLWISFNAAYAQDIYDQERSSERTKLSDFLRKLVDLDREEVLYHAVWDQFSGTVRVLLGNPFIFGAYWDFQRGIISEADWQESFDNANKRANHALARKDTSALLGVIMSRLYILRNQLIHGGATWNGAVNRDQLRDAVRILSTLTPIMIAIMMDHPNTLWGDAAFPVVE